MMTSSQIFSNEDTEIATLIEQNCRKIKGAINNAAALAGRDSREVLLVAVSKTVGLSEVQEAVKAGIHDFGENRTKLFLEKHEAFGQENWHFIGRIQTNKLKDVVGKSSLIHSVASARALEVINRLALERSVQQAVLLEVNVSGEKSKDGLEAKEVPLVLDTACSLPGVRVEGLMTMAPIACDEQDDVARRTFSLLRELRDNLVPSYAGVENISLNELSMGMSDDFEDAIKEGATIVRIGRRLWS